MPGFQRVDLLFILIATTSLGLSFGVHWSFALIPVAFLGLIFIPLMTKKTIVFLFVACFSIGIPIVQVGIAPFFVSDIFLMFIIVAVLLSKEYNQIVTPPLWKKFLIMLGALILSLIVNIPNYSLRYFASGVLFIFIFIEFMLVYLLGYLNGQQDKEDFVIKAFYISTWATVVTAIVQVYIIQDPMSIQGGAWGLIGGHHSGLGTFLVIPIALSLSRLLNGKNTRLIDGSTLIISIVGVFLSQSRSALFALLASVPILLIRALLRNRKQRGIIIITFIIIAIISLLLGQTVMIKTFHSKGGIDISTYSRLFIWQGAINSYENYPLYRKIFGCGVGAYEANNRLPINLWGSMSTTGAHNQYLHALVETGLIGLMGFLLLWGSLFLYLFKRLKSSPMLLGVWLTMLSFLLSGIVQENFWMNPWRGYTIHAFLYFVGLYLGIAKKKQSEIA